jgi:hypothetical protein
MDERTRKNMDTLIEDLFLRDQPRCGLTREPESPHESRLAPAAGIVNALLITAAVAMMIGVTVATIVALVP